MSRVEKLLEGEKPEPDNNSPRNREWVFNFRFATPRGHVYEGPFRNRILNQGEKIEASAMAAKLRDGMPYESVSPYQARMQEQLAWMQISLIDKPDWAENLANVIDDDVIVLLWKEVDQHEEIFRRPPEDKSGSQGAVDSKQGTGDAETVVVE